MTTFSEEFLGRPERPRLETKTPERSLRPNGRPYSQDPGVAYEERLSDWLSDRYDARDVISRAQARFDEAEKELAVARAGHAMVMAIPMPTRDAAE